MRFVIKWPDRRDYNLEEQFKALTIGDGLVPMNPTSKGPLRIVNQFERKISGAELNFAIGASRLDLSSKWISRLGNDECGKMIFNYSRGEGIDVSDVVLVDGYPTPLNFKEIRGDGSGKTFYYRSNSPILTLGAEEFNEAMFHEIDVLHLSGVFLSVMKDNYSLIEKIIELAQKNDVIISFDPNIRLKMWEIEEAKPFYRKIFPYIDILLSGMNEIKLIANIESKDDIASFSEEYNIRDVVIKMGSKGSMMYRDKKWMEMAAHEVHVVDTVGAGDGFDAGYIYGFLHDYKPRELLNFSNGVGAIVTTVSGDNEGLPYLNEVNALINKEKILER